MNAKEARSVLDQHRPELYVSTRDGHRECYCGHILAADETFASHLADALAMRGVLTPPPSRGPTGGNLAVEES